MTTSTKRLLKESTDLHKTPSPYFTAAPISDTNLHDWHFTLAGPPSPTPYSGGLYHGRITFPPTYPLRPPSFRFLTPSGRFEVNREICLSISGHHEETWQPAWGVRTALLAIRSEIMSAEAAGQVGGMEGNAEVRREYARLSRDWVCRECGEGSNWEVMRRVWRVCRGLGIEVDSELDGGDDTGVGGAMEKGIDETTEEVHKEGEQESVRDPIPVPVPVERDISSGAAETSPAPAPSTSTTGNHPHPRPTPTIPTATTATPAPASSPWLDRAIIAVVMALLLVVLRRVSGVHEL